MQAVAGGGNHSLALKNDGTVWAWGANGFGQLGNGGPTASNQVTPVQVKGPNGEGFLSGVQTIAAGAWHNLALKNDGTLWAWGGNNYGQLGDTSTTISQVTPVQVLSGVQAIAAGSTHSLALKNDGTVWAWGGNGYGQLGNGTTTSMSPNSTPVQVKGPNGEGFLSGVEAVAGGGEHSLALKNDGTVWAWGGNGYGQVGDTVSASSKVTPVQVKGPNGEGFLSDVKVIAGGGEHSLALKNDGTLWAWGRNNYGQLGDTGIASHLATPVQVKGPNGEGFLSDVKVIAGGGRHNLALKNDGTLWAWGLGDLGQLGDGNSGATPPVQVSGLSGVQAIGAGADHSLAVTSTDAAIDTTAPKVTSTVPKVNATEVTPTANVRATFFEEMDSTTIDGTTFTLFQKGTTNQIAAQVSYNADTDTAKLDPNNNLRRGVAYKAVVSTWAKDIAGNRLDQDDSTSGFQQMRWFFRVDD